MPHTPGPWVSYELKGGASTVPNPVAFVTGPTIIIGGDGKFAGFKPEDARLIAAAPELLEACKILTGSDGIGMKLSERINRAMKAIYKAEGK